MKKRTILLLVALFLLLLIGTALRPIDIPDNESKCIIQTGSVSHIYEDGNSDISIKLKESNSTYYINRGLERGLSIDDLKDQLLGEQVTIKYPKQWTILDPQGKIKHMSVLIHDGCEIYNEIVEG